MVSEVGNVPVTGAAHLIVGIHCGISESRVLLLVSIVMEEVETGAAEEEEEFAELIGEGGGLHAARVSVSTVMPTREEGRMDLVYVVVERRNNFRRFCKYGAHLRAPCGSRIILQKLAAPLLRVVCACQPHYGSLCSACRNSDCIPWHVVDCRH